MRQLLGVLLISAGCAHEHTTVVWWRAGATVQLQREALYNCERDSRWVGVSGNYRGFSSSHNLNYGMFERCMEANGWTEYESVEQARAATERAPILSPPPACVGPGGQRCSTTNVAKHNLE